MASESLIKQTENHDWLDAVRWNSDGLVAAIAQDWKTGKVLMQAWMNREALALTVKEQRGIYWSRSRGKLWRKGESSGHVQQLKELRLDCDSDSILMLVEQVGGMACHTGRESCYFSRLEQGEWVTVEPVLKDPEAIYGASYGSSHGKNGETNSE
ncbi:phosphoribosyl-AMP cyclohydrolase [Endozoicomonas lisbonensis]|uniref:Phosphoribosyl-AMP cyclohydrolase n=1 Tax=Endozoicomonas lisbonensis TaxID=3120522 RepID=A0ABV2SER8_9GAMM